MNQETSDQVWQQLQPQSRVFSARPGNDAQRIEYKPQFVVQLKERPAERHQSDRQEMSI